MLFSLMKKLAQYSVNIRERDFRKLQSIGAVEEPFENTYAITNPNFYKADTGLSIDNQWLEETYIYKYGYPTSKQTAFF